MTVPGRVEAAALLLSLDPPAWSIRHACAVAEVAAWLARRTEAAGATVDRRLVEAAALLHDTDKMLPPTDPAKRLRHGEGSADWLTRHGHPELASAVADHPVTRLADDRWYERWSRAASTEDRIVAYADKRAEQRLVSMDARFGKWDRRYPHGWSAADAATVRSRAAQLENDICGRAGVSPEIVGRLAWTGAAVRAARAQR